MSEQEMIDDYPRLKLEYTRLHEEYRRLTYTKKEVVELITECCSEIYSDDGTLKGKSPAELYLWMKSKKLLSKNKSN